MMPDASEELSLAIKLHDEFDRAFALPLAARATDRHHLVAIRIGPHPYALTLADIASLHTDRAVVPVPGTLPEWLGISGIRGEVVPVYSLAMLLGYARDATARWLALCGPERSFGLAIDVLEGHLSLLPAQIVVESAGNVKSSFVRAFTHVEGIARPIIDIPAIAAAISDRCAVGSDSKEK